MVSVEYHILAQTCLVGHPFYNAYFIKVGRQVQPSLSISGDAVTYLEELIIQLMYLISASSPHTIQDVEDRVTKTFPQKIKEWAIAFAKGKRKKGLILPHDKIHPFLCKVLSYSLLYIF